MEIYWFSALMASICLEGLGRKYLPQVPPIAFYFLKDVVLLVGYVTIKPPRFLRRTWQMLYRGFGFVWILAFGWTVLEAFNPSQEYLPLALLGLRAYWLWWMAPMLVATIMVNRYTRRRAIYVLVIFSAGIAILAALQFVSPPDSALNLYSVVDGEAQYASDSGIVFATGRARVSSTFAFLSGFQDFTILIPALLLSLGLEAENKNLRIYALGATLISAAVVPMSGSRAGVILGIAVLVITCWAAGLFFTAVGRRIMIGAAAAFILGSVAFPDAILGVQSRFDTDETQDRLFQATSVLPPVALLWLDYPPMGVGTGMAQNARMSLHIPSEWDAELESQRYLVEIGIVGFCLVWTAKFGVMLALLRCYKILKRAGRRAASGAALSYAAVTFFGNLTFDHIWQALFFIGCGFILAETALVLEGAARPSNDKALVPVNP